MATCCNFWKTVVWERSNKLGKWCPYSAEISQLLEQSLEKKLLSVWLGDVDVALKVYTVNLSQMVQISEITGTKSPVRRHICTDTSAFGKGILWLWRGDGHNLWNPYEVNIVNFIENCYQEGIKTVDLSNVFSAYNYELDLMRMSQRNKHTNRHRAVKRTESMPYPVIKCTQDDMAEAKTKQTYEASKDESVSDKIPFVKQVSKLWSKLTKPVQSDSSDETSDSLQKNKRKMKQKFKKETNKSSVSDDGKNVVSSNVTDSENTTYALVDGKPWYHHWPPHTPQSKLKPVPGIIPLKNAKKTKTSKKKGEKQAIPSEDQDVFDKYTEDLPNVPESDEEQVCIICYEALTSSSTYSDDNIVCKLNLCSHMFHKACLKAMYDSGPKDKYLQCPTCKKIHGEKCGMQPPGEMVYHVLPYSLPSFANCDTIRIIYDIQSGIQSADHPHPGKGYSARGFPRHCYLPDNEKGRKVLRLLVKAWERKLVFTIGRSSTTGEENTVTWNEIHHKTEFGCNTRGHGFPDPNFFDNILAELEAHGVTDSVYNWYPV